MGTSIVIEKAVELLRQCYGGIYVRILSDMIQKYPDSYSKNGYWGVDIEIGFGDYLPKHKVFFKYELAEDILFYGGRIGDSFVHMILKDDVQKLIKLQRKLKLNKLNEFNE